MKTPLTPYETSYGCIVNTSPVIRAIERLLISKNHKLPDYEILNNDSLHTNFITGADGEQDIPMFLHPILIRTGKDKDFLISDVRSAIKYDEEKENLFDMTKNELQLRYEVNRNILTNLIISDGYGMLDKVYAFSGKVFSMWITSSLSRVLNLDPGEKQKLNAIILAHYHRISTNTDMDSKQLSLLIFSISKATGFKENNLRPLMEKLDFSNGRTTTLIENIILGMNNVKTNNITVDFLLNVISGSWYGPNASEAIPISLEHMPTWLAILYSSMTEKSFSRSGITMIVGNLRKKSENKDFIKDIEFSLSNMM